jgi:hypothetical protein
MVSFRFKSSGNRNRKRAAQHPSPETPATELFVPVTPEAAALPADAVARGWYASTLELRLGLDVTEDVPADQWPPELLDRLSAR